MKYFIFYNTRTSLYVRFDHMYEATKEPVFGAGFLLYEAAYISHNMTDKNANLMGRILEDIKRKHKGATLRPRGPIVAE